MQGLGNDSVKAGVIKQFSMKYPDLTIILTNSENKLVKVVKNGKEVK